MIPKRLSIPKFLDILHATVGSLPLFKSIKLKLKQIEKHDSKDSQTAYLYTKQKNLTGNQEK